MKPDSSVQRIGYYPGANPPSPQPPQRPRRSRRSKKKWNRNALIRLALLAVCVVVFITCFTQLFRYFSSIHASRKASRELEQLYSLAVQESPEPTVTPTPSPAPTPVPPQAAVAVAQQPTATPGPLDLWPTTYPSNPYRRISSAFYQLQRENEDIVAWLRIDGVVEEPVLQRDNSYYLTHNALGQRSVTGALFLDETCDLDTVPTQIVVHGHNMKEGAMFGSLKKYKVKDASFYRSNPFIEFNTIYENGRYVIFAVAEVDIRYGRADYLPFWHDVRFSSAEAFMSYVQKARSLSHYHCNVDVQPGDRLLTLSTCTGNDDNKRLIVMARKIRDYENELELQTSILTTYDR